MHYSTRFCLIALLAATLLVPACVRQPRPDDAGDYAFARQVIPKLYGRKAKGYDEVKLVGDMSTVFGREITLRALMDQPDFGEHWSEVLVDNMRINRTGIKSQSSCFPETLTAAANGPDLARWIRDHYASAGGSAACSGGSCGNFTMSDVLRSSIRLDDLSPAYRGYLFPLINKPPTGNEIQEHNKRSDLFKSFETVYLGRGNTCLGCHNSAWSMSGAQSHWNRTHPIPVLPELAVYGSNVGRLSRELESMMRTDAASGTHRPWGMSGGCGSFSTSVGNDTLLGPGEVAFLAGAHGKQGSVFDIDRQLRDGINEISSTGLQRSTSAQTTASCSVCNTCTSTTEPVPSTTQILQEQAAAAILGSPSCTGCHASNAGGLVMTTANWKGNLVRTASGSSPLPRVKPGDAANSYLMAKLRTCTGAGCPADPAQIANGTQRMPYGGPYLSMVQIATVENWINGMPVDSGCGSCGGSQGMCDGVRRELDPDQAMALLVGANAVNAMWTEVMGYPLPIDNGFPRNDQQRNVLWNLTEFNFLNRHWSPREVLVSIFKFRFYNRLPPSANTGGSGYELSMLFDPWVEGDPRIPPQAVDGWVPGGPAPVVDASYTAADHPQRHHNAMTEAVHRYSARNLFNSVARAMGWPKPKRFPGTTYPSAALAGSMGQFIKDAEPGFRGTDMQGLLAWEDQLGVCAKPNPGDTDWIDRLLAARTAFDLANPADPISVRDFAQTMRDWLVADGELRGTAATATTNSESQLIANLFGVTTLNTSVSSVPDLATKTRRYCGVLLKSPQFMLAGIAPTGLGAKPRLKVCNPGDDCNYQAMCNALRPSLGSQTGHTIICGTDSVTYVPRFREPILTELFPRKWLWGMEKACWRGCQLIDRIHLHEPREIERQVAPQLVPDDAADSLPTDFPLEIRNGRILVVGLAGEKVEGAKGVVRLGKDNQQVQPGQVLAAGERLVFEPNGELKVGEDTLQAPAMELQHLAVKYRQSERAATAPLIIYVVGRERLHPMAGALAAMAPPMPLIEQLQGAEWMQHGSAGRASVEPDPRARLDTPERQRFVEQARQMAAQSTRQAPPVPSLKKQP